MNALLRSALVLILIVHAFAHLPGFIVLWEMRSFAELPYTTRVLGGFDVGVMGTRVIGTLWLAGALGMAGAAAAVHYRINWMPMLLWPLIGLSTVLCLLGWSATRIGLAANLVLVALMIPVATPLRVTW